MKFKLFAVMASLLLLASCSSGNTITVNNSSSPSSVVSVPPTVFKSTGNLKVHFIDVGQGDSILVQTPGGKVMLIDAGKKEDGSKVVNYLKSQGISKIDALVNTYPADDHIGGMTEVANNFEIASVFIPRKSVNSTAQKDFLNVPKIKEIEKNEAKAGVRIEIDPAVDMKVLAPVGSSYTEVNDFSTVVKVSYGNNSFLLTGDALSASEKDMLAKGNDLKSTVLKVGNHGGNTSTTPEFLSAVSPTYAVISAGKGNASKETLDKLTAANVKVYRTDESGTIVATTDGLTLNFTTSSSSVKASTTPVPSAQKNSAKPSKK